MSDDNVSFVFGAPHPHVDFDLDAIEAIDAKIIADYRAAAPLLG